MKSTILAIAVAALCSQPVSDAHKTQNDRPGASKRANWHKNPVIAHRGAFKKKNLPENSIASLKEAIRLGCFGTEFDVHMTKDSILVVNHDPEFLGMSIPESTYAQLLVKKHDNGEQIPTLEAYLKEGIKQKRTKLILELKPSNITTARDLQMTSKAVSMVNKLKATDWVDYISFSYDILKHIRKIEPEGKVAYLKGDVTLEKLKADGFYGADYNLKVYKQGEWFEPAKKLGLTINAWTVNSAADMNWLLDNKADFITTNEPELLFDILAERRKK